jgi:HlyD family secretion protein
MMSTTLSPAPSAIRDTSSQDRPLPPRSRTRGRLLVAAGAAAVLAAAALSIPAMLRALSADSSVSAARLTLAAVERGRFVRDIAADGKVVSASSPTLYAPSAGTVALRVHAGDNVQRGQVLAVIDSPDLAARLVQERSNAQSLQADAMRAEIDAREQRAALQSALDTARIDEKTAENDLSRQQKAFDAGAAAGIQVDHAKDRMEKARIAVRNATSALALKEDSLRLDVQAKQLAYQRQLLLVKDLERQVDGLAIRSPAQGQVGQVLVAERASVARDAPLLSVVDLSALEVQMQVAESFARDLAVGMPGDISGNGRTWPGRVSAVSPEVVGNEVAARLRFAGTAPDQLRQNQRLAVRVILDQRDGVLTVRRGSFVDESGGAHAYVVRDGHAVKLPIRIGARSIDKVEILEGLNAGDQVVISGAEAFHGADQVAIAH